MTDPTLSEIVEDHASGRDEWEADDVDVLVTEIERQASEIERLREAITVLWNWMAECGVAVAPSVMERLQELGVAALDEKEPD